MKRLLSLAALALLAFSIASPVSVLAISGTGSLGDPFVISSCADFKLIGNDPTAQYSLAQNINCTADGLDIMVLGSFSGSFNGNNHTITLNLDSTEAVGSYSNVGLFTSTSDATIKNLKLAGTVSTDSEPNVSRTGALIGAAQATVIDNVQANVAVSGDGVGNVGGLVGDFDGAGDIGQITNSSTSGSVVLTNGGGKRSAGGLVGLMDNGGEVTNSSSSMTISAPSLSSVGGLVGRDASGEWHGASYTNVYATGSVSGLSNVGGLIGWGRLLIIDSSYATGDVSASDGNVGGLIGYTENDFTVPGATAKISGSYATGTVSGLDSNIGGLIGWGAGIEDQPLLVEDSYATGAVSGYSSIGGLVGMPNNYVQLKKTYATGTVSGQFSVGGLVGVNEQQGLIERSYATGNVEGCGNVGGLMGLTSGPSLTRLSFATGNLTVSDGCAEPDSFGGFVGVLNADGEIEDCYARGAVTGGYVASFVGAFYTDSQISRSYGTGLVTVVDGDSGGFGSYGDAAAANNSFWDVQTTGLGTSDLSDDSVGGTGKTSAQMKNIATYTATTSVGLTEPWDFVGTDNDDVGTADIWGIINDANDGYPCLTWHEDCTPDDGDGVAKAVENAAPNGGDGNNDGLDDGSQAHVTSFVNGVTGQYVTLAVDEDCSISSVDTKASSQLGTDGQYSYPVGLMDFTISCGTPGYTANISQYYFDPPTGEFSLRKFINGSFGAVTSSAIVRQTIGGTPALKITYSVTDGGPLDEDGLANGTIIDPAGPATLTVANSANNSANLASTGSSVTLYLLVAGGLIAIGGLSLFAARQIFAAQAKHL